jgi:hypothetical protein
MFAIPSFLADMVHPSAWAKSSRGDVDRSLIGVAFLAQLDEVGILGKAARVDVQGNPVLAADSGDRSYIRHRNRLASAGIVGDREHAERNAVASHLGDQLPKEIHVHVALEGVAGRGYSSLRNHQIARLRAGGLDVGPRGIEMRVVGDHLPRPA